MKIRRLYTHKVTIFSPWPKVSLPKVKNVVVNEDDSLDFTPKSN